MGWFGKNKKPSPSTAGTSQEKVATMHSDCDAVVKIVKEYGSVLEKITSNMQYGAPQSLLPRPPSEMKQAIIKCLYCLHAQKKLDNKTFDMLRVGYASLATFLDDADAKAAVALQAAFNSKDVTRMTSPNVLAAFKRFQKSIEESTALSAEFDQAAAKAGIQIGKLATNLDSKRPYFSGLLIRYDEQASKDICGMRPPSLPEDASDIKKGQQAAPALASVIASEAMSSHGKFVLSGNDLSIMEGAVGITYGLFILVMLSHYLKRDGVSIDCNYPNYAAGFARIHVYLDDTKRQEMARKGLEIFRDMLESNHQNIREWKDLLLTAVQGFLMLAASEKRTKEVDEECRKIFASLLGSLYKALERPKA